MTDAELIDRLIREAAQSRDWLPGHLPVFNLWGPAMYLTAAAMLSGSSGTMKRAARCGRPIRPIGTLRWLGPPSGIRNLRT
ncbi:hypothetical protein ACQP2P_13430 [Dactylosporangium sp. CA-139114]|uniref:hypothetical protein n=1 Tax=Dactylosporangium sp. CA-139114 TaxID=3239931 RepID=UPI003D960328